MELGKFEFGEETLPGKLHPVAAAIKGLRKVRASWLRDPAVVAVDVGYRLLNGKPIGPKVYNYFKVTKDDDGSVLKRERLCPDDLAVELDISPEDAAEASDQRFESKLAELLPDGLPEGIDREVYSFPWIRVHINNKLTPEEVEEKKRRLYHKWPVTVDKKTFQVHVVQALYKPIADDWDEAFQDLCDATNGEGDRLLTSTQKANLSEEQQEKVARNVAFSHVQSAMDKRYGAPSVAGVAVERDRPVDPLTGGISIGNSCRQVGTIGAIVWDRTDCKPCILSCWHVLDGGRVETGEPCLQPATRDGGTPSQHTVGWLKRSKVGRNVDAALADLAGSRGFSAGTILCGPDGCGAVNIAGVSQMEPKQLLGTPVWKSGRTTGVTKGIVDGVGMSLSLDFTDGSTEIFHDQLHIVPDWPDEIDGVDSFATDTEVSQAGDSGAIWLDDQMMAVGLNFAGDTTNSEIGDFAVANLMTDVEREMNISLTPVFMHPYESAESRRENLLWAAIAELHQQRAAEAIAPDLADALAEILGRASGRFAAEVGPIGLPESRPGGGGPGAGAISLPESWPGGGGSPVGSVGLPESRPGGGRRGG